MLPMQRNALSIVPSFRRLLGITLLLSTTLLCPTKATATDTSQIKKWSTNPATLKILTAPDLFTNPLSKVVKTSKYRAALKLRPHECPDILVDAYLSYKYRNLRLKYQLTLAITTGTK